MEDVGGDDLVAAGGGVDVVWLHEAGDTVDLVEDEGEHGDFVLVGEQDVGLVELADVVAAVAGRDGDAGEGEGETGGFELADDAVEVAAGVGDGEAAEAVVAAELDDDEGGVEIEDAADAGEAVLGGVAADAFVDDAVVVTGLVQVALEEVGVAFAGLGAVAGGEGVAEADEFGTAVGGERGVGCIGGGVGGGGEDGGGGAGALRCGRGRHGLVFTGWRCGWC